MVGVGRGGAGHGRIWTSRILNMLAAATAAAATYIGVNGIRVITGDADLSLRNYLAPQAIDAAWWGGKVVWITGASSGIGYSLALAVANAGATVVASARRISALEQLASSVDGTNGGRVVPAPLDVVAATKDDVAALLWVRGFVGRTEFPKVPVGPAYRI